MDYSYPNFKPVGHNKALETFLNAWKHDKLHHAWLFCGIKAIGKASVAHYLTRFILTHKFPQAAKQDSLFSSTDMGKNNITFSDLDVYLEHPDIRHYFARSNPNFISIQREIDKKSGKLMTAINVDAIRKINQQLATTRSEGYRVIIVDSVDEMNINAANAILKILEEPPKHTIFFLISHNPNKLLPTIISRCRKLEFNPLKNQDMLQLIQENNTQLSSAEIEIILWLANGAVGKAFWLCSEEGQEIWQEIRDIFSQLTQGNLSQISNFCTKYGRRGHSDKEEQKFQLLIELWLCLIQAGCFNAGYVQKTLPSNIQMLFHNKSQKSLDEWLQLWDKMIKISGQLLSGDIDRATGFNRMFLALSNL